MPVYTTGQRIKSSVCDTEVMVMSAPGDAVEVTCGGVSMGNGGGDLDPGHADGTTMGKRYINDDGSLELLCVKAGEGSLAVDGVPLKLKESKKLPKTD